jgi:hypothetical protein
MPACVLSTRHEPGVSDSAATHGRTRRYRSFPAVYRRMEPGGAGVGPSPGLSVSDSVSRSGDLRASVRVHEWRVDFRNPLRAQHLRQGPVRRREKPVILSPSPLGCESRPGHIVEACSLERSYQKVARKNGRNRVHSMVCGNLRAIRPGPPKSIESGWLRAITPKRATLSRWVPLAAYV